MLSLFGKLKALFPTLIVASAVAITVKLLTTETPQNLEILQVKAEEDIKTEDYEDIIEEPELEVLEEEVPPEEEVDEEQQDEEETEEVEKGVEDEQREPEEKQEKQEQQKQPVANRRFKQTLMGNLLGRLIKPKDKN